MAKIEAPPPNTKLDELFEKQQGRPPIELPDLDDIEQLCSLNCTTPEIAAFFHVSVRTVTRWLKNKAIKEAVERGRAGGKLSVRRQQQRLLEAGNPTMGIWLGKVLLHQKEPEGALDRKVGQALVKRLVGVDIDKI